MAASKAATKAGLKDYLWADPRVAYLAETKAGLMEPS
jgi:hypothetical protein